MYAYLCFKCFYENAFLPFIYIYLSSCNTFSFVSFFVYCYSFYYFLMWTHSTLYVQINFPILVSENNDILHIYFNLFLSNMLYWFCSAVLQSIQSKNISATVFYTRTPCNTHFMIQWLLLMSVCHVSKHQVSKHPCHSAINCMDQRIAKQVLHVYTMDTCSILCCNNMSC